MQELTPDSDFEEAALRLQQVADEQRAEGDLIEADKTAAFVASLRAFVAGANASVVEDIRLGLRD